MVLCIPPVRNRCRNQCRKFPARISATVIDWFHPWPSEALISVAMRLLGDADTSISELKENVAHHMSFVHQSVEECCNVYTTPELPRSHPALPDPVQELVREGGCDEGAPPEGPVKLRGASTQVAEPPRCSTPSSCSPMSPRKTSDV